MRLSVVGIRGEVKVSVASVSPLRSLQPVNPNPPDVRRRLLAAGCDQSSVCHSAPSSDSSDMASASKDKASASDDEVTVVEEVEHSFTR